MADRQYELLYILPPDSTEQQVNELHEQIASVVSRLTVRSKRPKTGPPPPAGLRDRAS